MLRLFRPPSADPGDPTENQRGARRLQRVQWTVAASVIGRGTMLLGSLLTVPLTLNYLGPVRYGYWVAIVSTTTLLAFADFGLGYGLLNRCAAALGRGERAQARRVVSNTFSLLAGIALIGAVAAGIFSRFLPWERWFTGADEAAWECARAVTVLVIAFFAGLPFATGQRTMGAAQQGFWSAGFDAGGSIVSIAALLIAISLQGGLVMLALAFASGPLITLIGGWLWCFLRLHPDLRPRAGDWDARLAREIAGDGLWFVVLQAGGVILAAASSLIVLRRCGPVELSEYSLVAKLFQFGPQIAGFWFAPLWPAYAEAIARGDADWTRRALRHTTLMCTAAGLAGCCVLVPAMPWVLRVWTGTRMDPAWTLRIGLAGTMILSVGTTSISTFLNASRVLRAQAVLVVAHVAVTLILAWIFAGYWGSAGIAWGLFAGYALIIVPAYLLWLPRVLSGQRVLAPVA